MCKNSLEELRLLSLEKRGLEGVHQSLKSSGTDGDGLFFFCGYRGQVQGKKLQALASGIEIGDEQPSDYEGAQAAWRGVCVWGGEMSSLGSFQEPVRQMLGGDGLIGGDPALSKGLG